MLKLIKKYKILYYMVGLGVPVLVMLLTVIFSSFSDATAIVVFTVCLMFIILWGRFCGKKASDEYRRMLDILNEQCDPEGYLAAQREIYRAACKRKMLRKPSDVNVAIVRINRAVAINETGEHRQASAEIKKLLALPMSEAVKDDLCGLCYCNLAAFAIGSGAESDLAAVREHLEKAREHIKKSVMQRLSPLELSRLEYRLDVAEGKNLQTALDFFTRYLQNASCERMKNGSSYILSLIYRQLGDTENERAQLEFVAQNAPKAHIGKQAAERLAELSAQ